MEYSSTKRQRLPGISFMMDNSSDCESDCSSVDEQEDCQMNNNNNNDMSYNLHSGISNDVTMNSDTNNNNHHVHHHHVHYHRCNSHVESPLFSPTEETSGGRNDESDATMESPINAMTSYSTLTLQSATNNHHHQTTTTQQSTVPSAFFSPTSNALNQSLLQHAESLVDGTTETPLERVENGVMDVMDRLGLALFSSVKKRTLGEELNEFGDGGGDGVREEERGEETIVLDVAAAYMARLARDGLYDNDGDEDNEFGHSSPSHVKKEEGVRVNESECELEKEENIAVFPHSPPLIPVQEEVEEEDGDSIHDEEGSNSHDESNLASFEDSCYHEDGNNHNDEEEEEDEDLNISYYISNTAGFCSSESVNESSISETASEEDEYDDEEEEGDREDDDGGFHAQEVYDDANNNDDDEDDDGNKSCSLDLTGIEQIMNLDDSIPSVIPKMQLLCQSNSDVDLSGIEGVMNLDDTLPLLEDHRCCEDDDGKEEGAHEGIGNLDLVNDGDGGRAEPSSIDDKVCNNDDVVSSLNGVDSSSICDNKENNDDMAPSNRDTVQDEPSHQDNQEGDDDDEDDDFVPSALKEMISQQESQISSLLGSISNMQSTPGRIKKLEASLMGDEDDEDAGLNGIVDMTNVWVDDLTPVKRRLELVAEEEQEIESAGRVRMKQNALFKSGLEPEMELGESEVKEIGSTNPPNDLPESDAKDEAAPFQQPSMELGLDVEQEDVAATESPGIAADSSEAPCKSSPWLSFISKQSPPSQPQEAAPSQPDIRDEEADGRMIQESLQESPSTLTSTQDAVSQPTQESQKLGTSTEPMIPTDTSNSIAENEVPDSILQMFADAENAFQNVMDSSMLNEKDASESADDDDDVDSLDQRDGIVLFDDAIVEPAPTMYESEMLEEPTQCDEVEFTESDQMNNSLSQEKQVAAMQDGTSVEEKEAEAVDHSTSSEAIGSVIKTTGDFQVAEPSVTGEEPTLECLRGAFLAAESKLEAESNFPAPVAPEFHDATEEADDLIADSIASDNKSDSSSIVNATFETANFSLGDIEKTANDHLFFDAEDNMKCVNDDSSAHTASEINLDIAAEEEDKVSSASFENTTLPSENIKSSEDSFEEADFVEPSGDGVFVDKLNESIENPPSTFAPVNDSEDKIEANAVVTGSSPTDSHSTKLSPGNSDVSVLNESMFMPNSSVEVVSPPPIVEEKTPSVVADTLGPTTEEEYESEEGDDDEDFFPNRDLRSSSNAPRESEQVATNSSVTDKSSQSASVSSRKHDVKNQITSSVKESTSRLPKLPGRMQTGSTSAASSKHRIRQSTSATSSKSSLSSQTNSASSSSKGGMIQRQKDSASQTRHPRARIRAKKNAAPINGKENNISERTSKENSSVASKKSIYSVERLERLSKPRRQSMIPEPSPVKQRGFKKVASIDRLSRLAQPRRQSVVPTNTPKSPVQKKAPPKVASFDHLSRLAQPRRQSIVPTNTPKSPVQKRAPQKAQIERLSQLAQPKKRQSLPPMLSPVKKKEQQKVAAGTPSFVRRSKLMSSSKPTTKSTEEMEQEEMSQFKPFKAKPLNGKEVPSRFKALDRKPPRINVALPAPATKPRPPAAVKAPSSRLYQPSPRRHKVLTFGESQQSYLNNGLRSQPPLPSSSTKLTTPKPFGLSTRTNIMSREPPVNSDEIELQKKFKAKPYPFPRQRTMSFSQPKSSEELELEECRKQFKALPLPASVSTTRTNHSNIPYHIKAQQQYEIAMERKQRIAEESQETVSFKARPIPRSTYEERKVTRQSTSSVTRTVAIRPPRLSLASRAEERKLFDEHANELREKDAQMKEDLLRQQQEWEEEELKQKRMTTAEEGGLCFKAREIHIEYM